MRKVGGAESPTTTVILEIEYATGNERQAKQWAHRHAVLMIREEEVMAVEADSKDSYLRAHSKRDLPITERYLS